MCKKIALYVEGQTEQILINHFILMWRNYEGIRIENIKLKNNLKNPVSNYNPEVYDTYFVIINTEGMGHLNSSIAQRADKQIEKGFEVLGLRDLDFENLKFINNLSELIEKFKFGLKLGGCKSSEKIKLYFAIMTIEAWILPFTTSIANWAEVSENEVLEIIKNKSPNFCVEQIRSPSSLLEIIGKNRKKDPKSFHEIKSLISNITTEMIHDVYASGKTTRFNIFWVKIISLMSCEN